ncbi:MAG: hypothetical protein AB7V53_06585 [Dongiaceae bacterium]
MQQALDELYRRQPEAFAREPVALPATEDDAAIDHAIGLHHLLAYGRLAGERDLARLRDDAARSGGAIGAPLGEAMAKRRAEILAMAPAALRDAAGRRSDASAERLGPKVAAVDRLLDDQRRAVALEQSIALGQALLREDPDRYEELLGETEGLTAALAPDPVLRGSLSAALRRRYATAALEGELGPAGDPARAEADLARGRFRGAFEADEHAAWKEFAAFGRQRRDADAVKLARDDEVAAAAGMLARLDAAARGEAPLPPVAAIEAAFPGEGEARQAAAKRDLKWQLYETQIALQPFEADEDWILAGEEGEDALLRIRIAFNKRQAVERGDWDYLRRQAPMLAAAIEAAVEDPAKLGAAIALYQRHLAKLGVPPEKRRLLPDEARQRLGFGGEEERSPAAILGGDGQERLLEGGQPAPADAPAADSMAPAPTAPSASPKAPRPWHFSVRMGPTDPEQARRDIAIVQDGGAGTLTPARKIDLLKYWYAQPESAITDADRIAMRDLFVVQPIEPALLAYEAPIYEQITRSIRADPVVAEGLRAWASLGPTQWQDILGRLAEHTAQPFSIVAPPIVFNDKLPRTADGVVTARFMEATKTIEVNPIDLDSPKDAGALFFAPVDIPARIVEETVHAYQWEIMKRFSQGKIAESDPMFPLAELFLLQQPWMYIDPSRGLFKGDMEGYKRQPREEHAKHVADFIANSLYP